MYLNNSEYSSSLTHKVYVISLLVLLSISPNSSLVYFDNGPEGDCPGIFSFDEISAEEFDF